MQDRGIKLNSQAKATKNSHNKKLKDMVISPKQYFPANFPQFNLTTNRYSYFVKAAKEKSTENNKKEKNFSFQTTDKNRNSQGLTSFSSQHNILINNYIPHKMLNQTTKDFMPLQSSKSSHMATLARNKNSFWQKNQKINEDRKLEDKNMIQVLIKDKYQLYLKNSDRTMHSIFNLPPNKSDKNQNSQIPKFQYTACSFYSRDKKSGLSNNLAIQEGIMKKQPELLSHQIRNQVFICEGKNQQKNNMNSKLEKKYQKMFYQRSQSNNTSQNYHRKVKNLMKDNISRKKQKLMKVQSANYNEKDERKDVKIVLKKYEKNDQARYDRSQFKEKWKKWIDTPISSLPLEERQKLKQTKAQESFPFQKRYKAHKMSQRIKQNHQSIQNILIDPW